ncbi:hypothetical protein MesoLj131b_69390 (plasmid) [Mesorhizobium sp. 131-2-5]|nr:hypothetical protein MesoLj131b_69390 [Mesorhizobium sp. 131-2-5]
MEISTFCGRGTGGDGSEGRPLARGALELAVYKFGEERWADILRVGVQSKAGDAGADPPRFFIAIPRDIIPADLVLRL